MICPECKNKPLSEISFIINRPRTISCKNCGTQLKISKKLKRGSILMMVILGILLLVAEYFEISLMITAPIFIVLWMVISFISYFIGTYDKVDSVKI